MLSILKQMTKNRLMVILFLLVILLVVLALGTKMSSSTELFLTEEEVAEKVKNANLKVNALEEQVKELQTEFSSHYHETKTPDIKI